jgi:ketosteroid isomerase-like protein
MNNSVDPVKQVLEGYAAAVHEKNVDKFMQLYDPQARVFDAWDVWSYEGVAARRKTIEEWFGSLGSETVNVTFDDEQVVAGPELAVLSATGRYAAFSADGKELRSMQNRFTWALKREGSAWKIVHEHTSVPIGSSELKGILQRAEAG